MRTTTFCILISMLAVAAVGIPRTARAGVAQADNLTCYKFGKDLNDGLFVGTAAIDHYLAANRNCEVLKVALHCTRTIRDNADDPNGADAGDFVCYRLKCEAASVESYGVAAVTALGAHLGDISTKKPMLCVPVETDLNPVP